MPTIIENINSLINTKNELNAILNENGVDGGEIFSEYPSYFRSVIAQGGGGSDKVSYSYLEEKLSYYPTYSYSNKNYVSYSYLGDIEEITYYIIGSGDPQSPENVYATKFELASYVKTSDLQSMSYVSKSELSAQSYITVNDLPDLSTYVSKSELSAQSYLTAVPNTYPTYTDISNMGYVTGTDLNNASYVSITNLSAMGYVTSNDLPVIDENIVPKENKTYTLGDADHLYNAAYTTSIKAEGTGLTIKLGSNNRYFMGDATFRPTTNNYNNLGTSNYNWATTYTSNLYLGSSNIKDLINGMFSYDSTTGTLTITTIS